MRESDVIQNGVIRCDNCQCINLTNKTELNYVCVIANTIPTLYGDHRSVEADSWQMGRFITELDEITNACFTVM